MRVLSCIVALLALTFVDASAQNAPPSYPTKFIRFIVPYAPGGSSDVLARTISQKLNDALGQTLVIDNRPGAGSMIGTDIAAKSPADGYTIILSDMPHTINPSIYAKVPYDPIRDFAPVTLIGVSPMFLFAHPSLQATNIKEFIALAKTQPGKIAIASGGTGATTHLMAELLQTHAGIKLNHVPYKGAGPALSDVVAASMANGSLVIWLTYFDLNAPVQRLTAPAPDGRFEPLRAQLASRRVPERLEEAPASQTISLRARSPGGVALAPDPAVGDAFVAWAALDDGKPQVFTTLVDRDGKKIRQRMQQHG